jgi:hypothetical protein
MYFSFDPNGDGYVEHSTEEEAKKSAQVALDYERDEALNEGWDENVENICWGKILGRTFEKEPIYIDDSDYELKEI